MRVALRTSGGRGEYELAGVHGDIGIAELVNRELFLELLPGAIALPTGNVARQMQGKPRIRLSNPSVNRHLYLILADALLLPKPKRELGVTPPGKLQLVDNNYSITSIQFDVAQVAPYSAIIRPTSILFENSSRGAARLDIVERLRILLEVWHAAAGGGGGLQDTLKTHRDALLRGDDETLDRVVKYLRLHYGANGDPLREISRSLNLDLGLSYWMAVHEDDVDVESLLADDDLESRRESAQKRLKVWRLQAQRGSSGALFARRVKRAYRSRCLFTGAYLPNTEIFGGAGVDSAHILPWAEYDLNEVNNGICLSKTCHWAFDAGILVLDFDDQNGKYHLSVSPRANAAEIEGKIGLNLFRGIVGYVPAERLPDRRDHWPSPTFLRRYNQMLGSR